MRNFNRTVFILYISLTLCNAVQAQLSLTSVTNADSIYYFTDSRDRKEYKAMIFDSISWIVEPMRYKTNDSWCYNGKNKNCKIYGRLYKWDDIRSVCPRGWRIPANEDWERLIVRLGGYEKAGGNLAPGNEIGFEFLFGYPPNIYGRFAEDNSEIHFWSASEYNLNTAWNYYLIKDKLPLMSVTFLSKNYSMNCVCVKDH
ncbi:MAG: hypothetical protein H7X71_05610 [Chitinophagales bacterium]|nr:hypothetical protein [Chitinophagales bacterium]